MINEPQLAKLNAEIIQCRKCLRLVQWREEVARVKRKAYRDQEYWGRAVPGFGRLTVRTGHPYPSKAAGLDPAFRRRVEPRQYSPYDRIPEPLTAIEMVSVDGLLGYPRTRIVSTLR